jgi:hypothetical protein
MYNGVVYSHSSIHLGNSLVQFYGGNVCSPYIFNLDGKIVFAIQRQLPAPLGIVDLFNPHFPAALHAPGLAEEREIVEVGWIVHVGSIPLDLLWFCLCSQYV